MDDAVDQLLKDHKMVRKILSDFETGHPRFPELLKTLRRVVLAHAWFEDEFFLPAVKAKPAVFRPFWDEVSQEHEDIAALLGLVKETPAGDNLNAYFSTLRSLLETHFAKEEDVLFPLARRVISEEGLQQMARDMEKNKSEVRRFIEE